MQWSLFLLILMGQCSFFTCRLYEYHFIEEEKTWEEAQKYCREEYTDLATVYDMTDMERLRDSTVEIHNAWIGLYNIPGQENKEWHWSLPGVEYSETAWRTGEPNDVGNNENCTINRRSEGWIDVPCTNGYIFICYNEKKKSNKTFHLINDTMSWPKAQNYCREHHTDLVSGLDQLNDTDFKNEIQTVEEFWIGLFRDTWRWSDGSHSSFRNWDLKLFKDDDSKKCGITMLNGTGKWGSDVCNNKKPFFCYDDEVILIKESKTWEEALNYCTENYCDLVSITNLHQQRWVQKRAKKASTPFVWLGLRYTCSLDFWFWVSDKLVCYDNWASPATTDDCVSAAAMDRGGHNKWFKKADTEKFNFICAL